MRLSGRQNSLVINLSLGSNHRVVLLTVQDLFLWAFTILTQIITVRKLSLSNSQPSDLEISGNLLVLDERRWCGHWESSSGTVRKQGHQEGLPISPVSDSRREICFHFQVHFSSLFCDWDGNASARLVYEEIFLLQLHNACNLCFSQGARNPFEPNRKKGEKITSAGTLKTRTMLIWLKGVFLYFKSSFSVDSNAGAESNACPATKYNTFCSDIWGAIPID